MPDMQVHGRMQTFDAGAFAQGASSASKAAEGLYRGQHVSAPVNPMSLLADAAEELTFTAAETQEKKVAERKKNETRRTDGTDPAALMAQRLQGMNPEQLKKFKDQVAKAGKDPQALKQLAADAFGGRAEQHLALTYAMEQFEKDDPELAAALKTAIASLEAEHGGEIRAEYNIDAVGADSVGGSQEGKALYRNTVLGHADVGDAFLELMDRYGPEGMGSALEFLRKAIGADLSAQTSSIDKAELEQSNRDLAHVQVMANLYRDCATLLETLGKRHGVEYA